MSTVTPPKALEQAPLRRVIVSSILGTAVEWYDYYLFAISASFVFNKLFFPELDPLVGTLSAFATFAVGFFVRPFGAMFFGHYGDRIGRKRVLVMTLILMGVATAAMGLLPTYATIGIAAPALLLLLRAIQGFGAGAEYGGAVLMLAESAPKRHRGLYSALPYLGVAAGLLAANGIFAVVSRLPDEDFLTWGWRIPFLLSVLGVGIGIIIRLRLVETPIFDELKKSGLRVKWPLAEVLKTSKRQLFCAWGARMGDNSLAYVFESFVIVYVTQELGLPSSMILTGLLISSAVMFLTVPAFAALSDRIGRRPVYMLGAAVSALFAYPFFALLDTKSTTLIWLSLIFASSIAKTMMTAAQAAWFAEMFDARLRYSGFALAREVTSPIAGGLAPMIAVALLAAGQGSPHYVVLYIVGLSVITCIAVALGPETHKRDMFPDSSTLPDVEAPEPNAQPVSRVRQNTKNRAANP